MSIARRWSIWRSWERRWIPNSKRRRWIVANHRQQSKNHRLSTIIRSRGREKILSESFRKSFKQILLAGFAPRTVSEEVRLSNVPPDPGALHPQQPGDRRRHHGGGGRDVHERTKSWTPPTFGEFTLWTQSDRTASTGNDRLNLLTTNDVTKYVKWQTPFDKKTWVTKNQSKK